MLRAEPGTGRWGRFCWRAGVLCAVLALACAVAHAQATPLTAVDNGSTTYHSSSHDLVVADGLVMFAASDGVHGDELWATDGTPGGTRMVKDINPGSSDSTPYSMLLLNGVVLFLADDGVHGRELWVTDGTEAGTRMLKDIHPGARSSSSDNLVVMNGKVYFPASDGVHGREVWSSDGTEAGTQMLADVTTDASTLYPAALRNVNGTLYFVGHTSAAGAELWKSDGTAGGTQLVVDFNPGTTAGVMINNSFGGLFNVGDTVFFEGISGSSVLGLAKSDGTAGGTTFLKDINTGGNDNLNLPISFGGKLYFFANDGTNGMELWVSDGTAGGTQLLKDINPGAVGSFPFIRYVDYANGLFLFFADNGSDGAELWASDGTADGTALLKDLVPASGGSGMNGYTIGGVQFGGQPVFFAKGPSGAGSLWTTDGTADGTVPLLNLDDLSLTSGQYLIALNGTTLVFSASGQQYNSEIYASDATAGGTLMLKDINSKKARMGVKELADVGGTLFFQHGTAPDNELWSSDGTLVGTALVKDINAGALNSGNPQHIVALNGDAYFSAFELTNGIELWTSDGTGGGTNIVKNIASSNQSSSPKDLVVVGSTLFFQAWDSSAGEELYASDGTGANTGLVKDINSGSSNSEIKYLTGSNGVLFFSARGGVEGAELWKSDGTGAGTAMVKNLAAVGSSNPAELTDVGGTLFFVADDGSGNGEELYMSDGTDTGTVLVKDIQPGVLGSSPRNLIDVGGVLFFSAYTDAAGIELWMSDGTESGTVLVKDINPGAASSGVSSVAALDGILYFAADDGAAGLELWRSDGTEEGTYLLRDIRAGSGSSAPHNLAAAPGAGRVFFAADDGASGFELYVTDGTNSGTWLVQDLSPGAYSSGPEFFTESGGKIFFAANHETNGRQLWALDPADLSGAVIGDRIFSDVTGDGTFQLGSGETGIDGVLVNLYRDNGSSAGILDASDTYVTSQYSSGGGLYYFTGLVDGDYIVQLDPSNFASLGVLETYVDSLGIDPALDPDNDIEGDDNGSADAFGGLAAKAVTLAAGTEPDTPVDGDGTDGNLTVDFGVILVPVAEILGSDPFYVAEGEFLPLEGAGTDSAGGSSVTYDWDWDDGSAHGTAQNPSHAWDTPGTYTVTLVVTAANGVSSAPVSVQVIVTHKAGERDLYIKLGRFAIDWKAHNDGKNVDSFSIRGGINPAGADALLDGATMEVLVNGESLGVVPLAANGKGSASAGGASLKASLKTKTGAFSFDVKHADLRAAIGLSNADEAGEVDLEIVLTVLGANLDTETFTALAPFDYTTVRDKKSKGSFNYKKAALDGGVFNVAKTTVLEDQQGHHKVTAKGYLIPPEGVDITPAGDVEIIIGGQALTIPFGDLTVADGAIELPKGAHANLAVFEIDQNKNKFSIAAVDLDAAGVPLVGDLATSHDLLLCIVIPTAGDAVTFESTVEILRSSPTSKTWKR